MGEVDVITRLSVDEYAFLTENFELRNKADVELGVKYLVFNRKKNMLDTIKEVIQNELDENERGLTLDYFGKEMSADELADKYKISRAAVYRNINNSKKKIEKFIKYVVVYDNTIKKYSVEDYMEYIQGECFES